MGVGIEFVTENSIRKYQVCKPVAPQQRKAKQRKILIFNENRDFLFSPKTQKSAVHDRLWAQRKIPVVLSFPYHRHKAGGASPLA